MIFSRTHKRLRFRPFRHPRRWEKRPRPLILARACHLGGGDCFFPNIAPARDASALFRTLHLHQHVRCPLHLRRCRQRRGRPPRRRQEVQPSCRARRAQGARRQGSLLGPGQLLLPVPRRRGRPVPRHPPPLHGLLQRGWRGVRRVPPRVGCPRLLRRRRYVPRARHLLNVRNLREKKKKTLGGTPRAGDAQRARRSSIPPKLTAPIPPSLTRSALYVLADTVDKGKKAADGEAGACPFTHPRDDDERDPETHPFPIRKRRRRVIPRFTRPMRLATADGANSGRFSFFFLAPRWRDSARPLRRLTLRFPLSVS